MMTDVGASRGSQLLEAWRGSSAQVDAARQLDLDTATYSRFAHGKRRPSAEVGFKIERLTSGAVPARAWFDPPRERKHRRSKKAA